MRNGNVLKMRVSEIRVKQIRVNQGIGVVQGVWFFSRIMFGYLDHMDRLLV